MCLIWKDSVNHVKDSLILQTFRLLSDGTADLMQLLLGFIPGMSSRKARTSLHYGWKLVQLEDTTGVVIPPVLHNNTWKTWMILLPVLTPDNDALQSCLSLT